MAAGMMHESIWLDRPKFEEQEARYQTSLAGSLPTTLSSSPQKESSLGSVKEIANARRKIQQTLQTVPAVGSSTGDGKRIAKLEEENQKLRNEVGEVKAALKKLEARVTKLEIGGEAPKPTPAKEEKELEDNDDDDDDDDDIDLFGSADEEESKEAEKLKQERLAQYATKKAKKPKVIAKSNIILDIKPWEDETDLKEMERLVRSIETDGLLWGASKLVPIAYGVKKLQIGCVVEDDKVGSDFLEEAICAFEDFVQSVDVAAFNKV